MQIKRYNVKCNSESCNLLEANVEGGLVFYLEHKAIVEAQMRMIENYKDQIALLTNERDMLRINCMELQMAHENNISMIKLHKKVLVAKDDEIAELKDQRGTDNDNASECIIPDKWIAEIYKTSNDILQKRVDELNFELQKSQLIASVQAQLTVSREEYEELEEEYNSVVDEVEQYSETLKAAMTEINKLKAELANVSAKCEYSDTIMLDNIIKELLKIKTQVFVVRG